jgi:hypothetical protein
VRQQLEQAQMPVEDAPNDDDQHLRQSYNFAPGYYGLVYRADGPEHGGQQDNKEEVIAEVNTDGATGETKYKLQAMQWGMPYEEHLIPRADMIQDWFRFLRSATPTTPAK